MDLNSDKSADTSKSLPTGLRGSQESQMFHVKHSDVPRGRETGSRASAGRSEARGAGAESIGGRRSKRAPLTFEEFAKEADALLAQGEKVTLARVRDKVGGGNQTLGPYHAKWKAMQRNKSRMGEHQGLLSAQTLALLAEDINNHRKAAQAEACEEMEDLREANQELDEANRQLQGILHEQEGQIEDLRAQVEQMHQAQGAQSHAADVAQSKLAGQVETLTAQQQELQEALTRSREAAVEARVKDAAQVSQIAALSAEVKRLREASDAAKAQVSQAEQKAAVARTQTAGKDELLKILQGQLAESQSRSRDLVEEARRSHERARVAEEAQQKLRHKLDVAHEQATDDRTTAEPGLGPVSGPRAVADDTSAKDKGSRAGFLPPSRSPAPNRGHSAASPSSAPYSSARPGPRAADEELSTFAMREREIEARMGPAGYAGPSRQVTGLMLQRRALPEAAGTTSQATQLDTNKPIQEKA